MPERLPLNPRLEFMRLLWAVDHALQSASEAARVAGWRDWAAAAGLAHRGLLSGISAGKLAEVLVTHPSTLSGVLKRLEARGHLERKPDPTDARRAQLRLTRKGRSIDALRAGTVESAIAELLSRASEADVAAAERLLQLLAVELEPRR